MATASPKRSGPENFDLAAMQEHAGEAAQLLKALANERRLQVLCLLAGGERSVGEINQMLDLSQSALSQHLAVLRDEGLVRTRREAQMIAPLLAFFFLHCHIVLLIQIRHLPV